MVFCCVLLAVASTFAQARSGKTAKADPISGTWTGTLTPQNAPGPVSVTMELKFDGKSAVTGTVVGPSESRRGEGRHLRSEERSAQAANSARRAVSEVLLVLDGTVAKGTASGKVNGDGGAGEFKITKKP